MSFWHILRDSPSSNITDKYWVTAGSCCTHPVSCKNTLLLGIRFMIRRRCDLPSSKRAPFAKPNIPFNTLSPLKEITSSNSIHWQIFLSISRLATDIFSFGAMWTFACNLGKSCPSSEARQPEGFTRKLRVRPLVQSKMSIDPPCSAGCKAGAIWSLVKTSIFGTSSPV